MTESRAASSASEPWPSVPSPSHPIAKSSINQPPVSHYLQSPAIMLPSVTSNSQCAPVPEGCGLAIPNSANDLLRFIQSQKNNKKSSASASSIKLNSSAVFSNNVADRQKRQEAERQSYERKLMQLEDLANSESTAHLKRAEERLLMCEEALLSPHLLCVLLTE